MTRRVYTHTHRLSRALSREESQNVLVHIYKGSLFECGAASGERSSFFLLRSFFPPLSLFLSGRPLDTRVTPSSGPFSPLFLSSLERDVYNVYTLLRGAGKRTTHVLSGAYLRPPKSFMVCVYVSVSIEIAFK